MAKTMYDYWFMQFDFPNETGQALQVGWREDGLESMSGALQKIIRMMKLNMSIFHRFLLAGLEGTTKYTIRDLLETEQEGLVRTRRYYLVNCPAKQKVIFIHFATQRKTLLFQQVLPC